jgi:hypothetical protein
MSMMPRVAAARIAWTLLCCVCAAPACAQYESGDFGVDQTEPVWLRALLDVRLVRGGPAPSWTDSGAGKLRYGGEEIGSGADAHFERKTRLALSQLAIELGAALPGDLRAHVQINVEPDIADSAEPWLIEAILRKDWGDAAKGFSLQGGVMNLPFSLEHTGAAWSPEFTISASALNTWLWEDASLAGLEGEWWHETSSGLRIGALVGTGFGPDRMARLLALRGWTLGDGISGINSDVPLPNRTERQRIFDERDHRPAAYGLLTISDKNEIASLKVGHFDNLGDQRTNGVWRTEFTVVGITLHPLSSIDVLAQYLDGCAHVAVPNNDSDLTAWYGLVSWHHERQRFTVRYDSFEIRDLDGVPNTSDNGDAVTVSWQFQWRLRHRISFEHIWLESRRPADNFVDPTPDGWQLGYRYRY